MAITDWPSAERPREKLLKLGAKNLTDNELLAIFLRTGFVGTSAVDLARNLLQHYGSLTSLFAADKTALCNFPGVGIAKYAQLQAVLEMSKRALGERLECGDAMNTPQLVRDFLRLNLDIGRLPARAAGRLVNHDPRIGQGKAHSRRPGRQQERPHRRRLPDTYC